MPEKNSHDHAIDQHHDGPGPGFGQPAAHGRLNGQQQPALNDAKRQHGDLWWQGIADLLPGHADHTDRVGAKCDQSYQYRSAAQNPRQPLACPGHEAIPPSVAELVNRKPDEDIVEPA